MWDRSVFKQRAKEIMNQHYLMVFLACFIATFLGAINASDNGLKLKFSTNSGLCLNLSVGPLSHSYRITMIHSAAGIIAFFTVLATIVIGILLSSFVFNIFRVGFCRYLVLTQQNRRPPDLGELFWGFSCGHYLNLVKVMFFQNLYIFLWSLILVIPGIVKAYEYTCVPYILAEFPDLDHKEALALSSAMTDGHKADIFILGLSFIGWELLGILLLGIGSFFVAPYVQLTNGEMYAYLRDRILPSDPANGSDTYQGPY